MVFEGETAESGFPPDLQATKETTASAESIIFFIIVVFRSFSKLGNPDRDFCRLTSV
jgi:hypothetical protein